MYVDDMFVEGGGTLLGTDLIINAINITVDDGGTIHTDGLGYGNDDILDGANRVNLGKGDTHVNGSSGGCYGGSSGRGGGITLSGQPYGHLFEPNDLGSAGGGLGGSGSGMLWMNVSNRIQIDGEVRANGQDALAIEGGGGSGGTIWLHCNKITGTGNITANGGNHFTGGSGGGGAAGRIAMYFWENSTYVGTFQAHGGTALYSAVSPAEPGGPGPIFIYHQHHQHKTLYINNHMRVAHNVAKVLDYQDLSTDSSKAWILPESGEHGMASNNHSYQFDELQIYGNAHLAVLPKPFIEGASLHFLYMIGDRSGFVHVGPYLVMDLRRDVIDTPFSSYVYDGGYLGLAPDTELQEVFIQVEGSLDHIINLTLVHGAQLRLFPTGSTNRLPRLDFIINGTTVIMARSSINASEPFAHSDQFNIRFGAVTVEGGGRISGKNMKITADSLTVDDGGYIEVNDGGHLAGTGHG